MVRRRARPPQDDPVRQRGDRLRHHRRHPPVRRAEQLGVAMIDDIRETIAAAARSNVSIYAHRSARADDARRRSRSAWPGSPTPAGESRRTGADAAGIGLSGLRNELRLSQESLRTLAEETGGFAAVNSNDFTSAFDRIVRDNSSYYVLAYYPPHEQARREVPPDRGPRVAARADGARAARATSRRAADPRRPEATPGAGASAAVTEALNSPLPVSGLDDARLRGAVQGHRAERVGAARRRDARPRSVARQRTTKVELSYLAVDANGKIARRAAPTR